MNRTILPLAAAGLLLLAASGCGAQQTAAGPPPSDAREVVEATDSGPSTEEDAVAQAVLDRSREGYAEGECPAEGHLILDASEGESDTLVVYALCSTGNYSFVSGRFEEVSGSGAIPSRLTFALGGDGFLSLTDYWEPEDGSGYADSILRIFPPALQAEALDAEGSYPALKTQKEAYARAYLKDVDREAEVGDYSDFDHPLAVDQGMSPAVADALAERMADFPFFLGTWERLEDGIRWVYETDWSPHDDGGDATYTKYNYETGETAERHTFLVTGNEFTEQKA